MKRLALLLAILLFILPMWTAPAQELQPKREGAISGRVVADDGQPLAGAQAMDLGVAKKTYEAVGRVVDDETGKPIVGAGVIYMKTKGLDGSIGVAFGGNTKTDEQGNFRLNGLTLGQYQLNFVDYESYLAGRVSDYYSDAAKLEIQGADVAGIEIRAKRGVTISGVAVTEDADSSAKSSLSQTVLWTRSAPISTPSSPDKAGETELPVFSGFLPDGMTPTGNRIGSDGSFSIKGVRPGKVMIQSFGVNILELKIVRIERGGVDVSEGIVVGAGREEINDVRIVFGKGECVIRGQVRVTGGKLPVGFWIDVVASNEVDGLGDRSGHAMVHAKGGRFVIKGLVPGKYQLMLMARTFDNPILMFPQAKNIPAPYIPAPVTQKVIVTKGQEAQVTMTLDLSKKGREEKQ
ncbi:MAG: hypothetical protein ACREAM_02750 [Blastocatellia bacterium]